MKSKSIFFFPDKCIGCKICEVSCALEHGFEINPLASRIRVIRDDKKGLDVVGICVQCEEAPCIDICPVQAISIDEKFGAIIVNKELCIGCDQCEKVCPYYGIYLDIKSKKAICCDLCNGDPACVKSCPVNALEYSNISNINKEVGENIRKEHKKNLDEVRIKK